MILQKIIGYKIIGWNYIISEKLKKSIDTRVHESSTGRIIVPSDLIKRVIEENKNNKLIDIKSPFLKTNVKDFLIDCYNVYDMIPVVNTEELDIRTNAINLLYNFISEEQSDLDCCVITNGSVIEKNGDNLNWKEKRVQIFKYITNVLMREKDIIEKFEELIDDEINHDIEPDGTDGSYHSGYNNRKASKLIYDSRCNKCRILKRIEEIKDGR